MRYLLLFFSSLFLFAEESALNVFSSLESSVEHLVHGAVNPITGDYVVSEADIIVAGVEPIIITRAYVSSDKYHETAGWTLNPQTIIHKIPEGYKVFEPSGAYLVYTPSDESKNGFSVRADFLHHAIGAGRGENSSAKNNLLMNRLIRHHSDGLIFYHADGSERHYHIHHKNLIRLKKEVKANGNIILYHYKDGTKYLSKIESYNPYQTKQYAYVEFIYHTTRNDDPAFDLITSDGRRMTFNTTPSGDKQKYYFYTDFHVHNSYHEHLNFKHHHDRNFIQERRFGRGRKAVIQYYEKGTNYLPLTTHPIKCGQKDPIKRRVAVYRTSTTDGDIHTQSVFHYYPSEKRTNVVYPNGRIVSYLYDNAKRITQIITNNPSNLSLEVHYTYDYDSNLTSIEHRRHCQTTLKKTFVYDRIGNLLKDTLTGDLTGNNTEDSYTIYREYDNKYNLKWIKYPDGAVHEYTYSKHFNHVTSHILTYRDEIKETTHYEYNSDYLITKEIHTMGSFTRIKHITYRQAKPALNYPETIRETYLENNQEHLLSKTHIHYNNQNLPIQTDHYDANDTYLYSLYTTYDKLGRLLTQTDPLGRISKTTYDEFSNITSEQPVTSPNTIYHTYDATNQRLTTKEGERLTTYTYNTIHQKTSETTPQNHTIHYTYDTESNPITVTDIGTTHTTYGPYHNPISQTDPLGNTTTTTYTALAKPVTITDPQGHQTTHTYNLDQTLAKTTTAETITTYTYDYKQRPTSITITDHQNNLLSKETTIYNYFGPTNHTDPLGHTTITTYDGAGRPIKTQKHTSITTTIYDAQSRPHIVNTDGCITKTTYDIASRPISILETDDSNTTYSLTKITYDEYDNKTSITTHNHIGPSTDTYTYDHFNRETSHTNALGHTSLTTYKEQPYTIIKTNPNNITTTTTHTVHGKPHTITTLDYKTTHTYDLNDNLIETTTTNPDTTQTFTYTNNLLTSTTHNHKTTTHTYDKQSRCITTALPNQTTITTSYNALSQPIHISSSDNTIDTHNTYDPLGNLLSSSTPDHLLTRTYDPLGNLLTDTYDHITIHHTYKNNQRTKLSLPHTTIYYTYNPYHLTSVMHNNLTHTYIYDTNHNIIRETNPLTTITHTINPLNQRIATSSTYQNHTITALDPVGNILSTNTSSYTYSPFNQILTETGSFNNTYTLDAHSNRLTTNNAPNHYSTDHELLSTPTHTYSYDPNGNRIATNNTQYTYDALGRLLFDGANTYTYDYFNRRLTENNTYYLYDNNLEIGREDREYRILGTGFGADIGATTFIYLNNTAYIPFHDLFGNISKLYTVTGTLLESYTHNPFGLEQTTTTPQNPYRYQSKRHTHNLVFFGRRLYDPQTATWLTPDPIGCTDSPNLYQYLHHNPLTNLDRFGLLSTDRIGFMFSTFDSSLFSKTSSQTADQPHPPRVTYDDNWERSKTNRFYWNPLGPLPAKPATSYAPSSLYETGGHEKANVGIGFINGIWNDNKAALDNARYISKLAGGYNVRGIYNATHGHMTDMQEYMGNKAFKATQPARQLSKMWDNFFENRSKDARFLTVCHSQGAVHVRNELINYSSERRKQIEVLAIAPGAYIYQTTCHRVTHYRAASVWRDFVPRLDAKGAKREQDTIIELASHPDAPLFDHPCQSPTYKYSIERHIHSFLQGK